MKQYQRNIIGIFLTLTIVFSGLFGYIYFNPYVSATVVRRAFDVGIAKPPENYDEIRAQVDVQENLVYPSVETDNIFDLYKPKNATGMEPVIIWVHGGAFVGGDKADITEYSVLLAQRGFVVANMNYQRAPEANYPSQIIQVGELYSHLSSNRDLYNLNMDKVFYAGDSAGAHIVSQFVLVQNDAAYSEKVGIKPVMAPNTIAGVGLFSGPYDLNEILSFADFGKGALDFFFERIGWAYFGERNWRQGDYIDELTIIDYVNEDFPPAFVTDGNTMTFTQDGLKLVDALENLGVDVTAAFYDESEAELVHEYQFIMTLEQSQMTFERFVEFLVRVAG